MPLSEQELRDAEKEHVVRAPVRARVVVPVQFVPNLVAALQEHMRVFSETYSNVGWTKGTRSTDRSAVMKSPARHASRSSRRWPTQHPNADTELHYRNAFELLAATILSAQSTDARVNMVTPALFARYPDAGRWRRRRPPSSSR